MRQPARYADQILDDLRITDPKDLRLLDFIAWERGALVQDGPLDGSEARVSIVGRKAIITVTSRNQDVRRRRFSIAHELGHLEMHRRILNQVAFCTGSDLDNWGMREIAASREQESNDFAAALLLPERFVKTRFEDNDPSLKLILATANEYETSLVVTARRFVHFSSAPCAVVYCENGYKRWFQGSTEFHEMGLFVDVKSKVISNSLTGSLTPEVITRPQHVLAEDWLRPGKYPKNTKLVEQTFAMPTYNAMLCLLWLDEDIDYANDFD